MFKLLFTTEGGISCEMVGDIYHFNSNIGGVTFLGEEKADVFKEGVTEEDKICFRNRVNELFYKIEHFKRGL